MFHFIKFLLLAIFLFIFLNLFRSNMDVLVALKFDMPLLLSWSSIPIGVTYLLLLAFCSGIIFAALIGAFRMTEVRAHKKELKKLRHELAEVERTRIAAKLEPPLAGKEDGIPSLLS